MEPAFWRPPLRESPCLGTLWSGRTLWAEAQGRAKPGAEPAALVRKCGEVLHDMSLAPGATELPWRPMRVRALHLILLAIHGAACDGMSRIVRGDGQALLAATMPGPCQRRQRQTDDVLTCRHVGASLGARWGGNAAAADTHGKLPGSEYRGGVGWYKTLGS